MKSNALILLTGVSLTMTTGVLIYCGQGFGLDSNTVNSICEGMITTESSIAIAFLISMITGRLF